MIINNEPADKFVYPSIHFFKLQVTWGELTLFDRLHTCQLGLHLFWLPRLLTDQYSPLLGPLATLKCFLWSWTTIVSFSFEYHCSSCDFYIHYNVETFEDWSKHINLKCIIISSLPLEWLYKVYLVSSLETLPVRRDFELTLTTGCCFSYIICSLLFLLLFVLTSPSTASEVQFFHF